jgi:hypothetical protein
MFRVLITTSVLCLALTTSAAVGAPFVNLNFEQASVVPNPPFSTDQIDAALAFPGWTATYNGQAVNNVFYNTVGIGTVAIALYDEPAQDLGIPLLEGNYYAVLRGDSTFTTCLSQIGDIPAAAFSIRFLSESFRGPPTLRLNGSRLSVEKINDINLDVAVYGADISSFRGQMVEIKFDTAAGGLHGLDAISFSTVPVPEPSSAPTLTVLARLFLGIKRSKS